MERLAPLVGILRRLCTLLELLAPQVAIHQRRCALMELLAPIMALKVPLRMGIFTP